MVLPILRHPFAETPQFALGGLQSSRPGNLHTLVLDKHRTAAIAQELRDTWRRGCCFLSLGVFCLLKMARIGCRNYCTKRPSLSPSESLVLFFVSLIMEWFAQVLLEPLRVICF